MDYSYVQYILSRLWYVAQTIPIPKRHAQQITAAVLWYLWQGNIFRVPATTLYRQSLQGGVGLWNIQFKCYTLFLNRNLNSQESNNTFTAAWLNTWTRNLDLSNPPNLLIIPNSLKYLKIYYQELCYLQKPIQNSSKERNRQVYFKMMTSIPHTEMRIKRNTELGVNFDIIWQNINCKILPAKIRSIWYYAVHDIFPTRSRLCKIKITADNKCLKCNQEDTIIHRFEACDNTKPIFERMTVYLKQHGINT